MASEFVDSPAAVLSGASMSCREFLREIHLHGELLPALKSTVMRRVIDAQAEALRLAISDQILQQAADLFRRRSGLFSAPATHAWLQSQSLSVADLEQMIIQRIRRQMVFQHVTSEARQYFDRHHRQWDRLSLRILTIPTESLASELKVQILEDGADMTTLARYHSIGASEESYGLLQNRFRCQLPNWCRNVVDQAATGDVIGPVPNGGNWSLLQVEAVQLATYDDLTEESVRQMLFRDWLSQKLRESNVTYPLLELLACPQNC